MGTLLTIKSDKNALEQQVSQEQFEILKANGYKGRVINSNETSKAAKEPAEVTETKKK